MFHAKNICRYCAINNLQVYVHATQSYLPHPLKLYVTLGVFISSHSLDFDYPVVI